MTQLDKNLETMKNLFEINTKENHISTIIKDSLRDVPINGDALKVLLYIETVKTLQKIGWLEHTCDWDLNTVIETMDGQIFETGHGFGDYLFISLLGKEPLPHNIPISTEPQFKDLELTLDPDDLVDWDLEGFSIRITDIKSITLWD